MRRSEALPGEPPEVGERKRRLGSGGCEGAAHAADVARAVGEGMATARDRGVGALQAEALKWWDKQGKSPTTRAGEMAGPGRVEFRPGASYHGGLVPSTVMNLQGQDCFFRSLYHQLHI